MKRLDENKTVERPVKTTRIHKRGNSNYVYHVVSTTYNPDKQFNTDSRVCVGKMVSGSDTLMIPNDKFETYYPQLSRNISIAYPEPPVFCDTLKAGAFISIRKILDNCGVKKILNDIYEDEEARDIVNMITYVETAGSIAYQHYPAFMRDHLQLGATIHSDSYLSRNLKEIITDDRINEFLRQWNKLHVCDDKIFVNFDGCNMNWEVTEPSTYAEFGAAKDDPTKPQANFMLAMDNKDGEPLDYDTYNGSVVDMSQCAIMVDRIRDYGYTNVGCIFDRGFFRQPVVEWLDCSGYDVIMMGDLNIVELRNILMKNYAALHNQMETQLKGLDVLGLTIKDTLWERERFFHLYYDDVQGSYQRRRFYDDILIMEEELEQLEEAMEMLEDMEMLDPHMTEDELKELKLKHRMAESKAMLKADMDYLKGMIKHQSTKEAMLPGMGAGNAAPASFEAASFAVSAGAEAAPAAEASPGVSFDIQV